MKKPLSLILALIVALCAVLSLAGCSKNNEASLDIVLITDGASVDDKAYNKNVWDGVKSFANDNKMSCRYYQPSLEDGELTYDSVKKYVKLSVDNGAKYIVVQGEAYRDILPSIASDFTDTSFLALGVNLYEPISNVMSVSFDKKQAGFLAGYASVALGNSRLGYLGSVNSSDSAEYGAGYVQGAAYGADEMNAPCILDYANYDADNLAYDYSFNIRPVYKPVSESKEKTYKVNAIGGLGSGVYTDGENVAVIANPTEDGKVFDHWEKRSDTEGKSDKKVNINSSKKEVINLLVGDCDCTLEAVYTEAETQPIRLSRIELSDAEMSMSSMPPAKEVSVSYSVEDSTIELNAPAASKGMTFGYWMCKEGVIEDVNSPCAKINVAKEPVEITAVYVPATEPTFYVNVENGTGTGSYGIDERVELIADAPDEGYMFYKWENIDNQGLKTGVSMDNEYNYNTSFKMVDRCASLVKMFYNKGTQVVFGGGNPQSASIFTAAGDYTYKVYGFGWGYDQRDMGNCLASVVTDFNKAAYNALSEFKGGSDYQGNCSNGCLYVTGISIDKTYKDDDGNDVENEEYNEGYANAYNAVADGKIKIRSVGSDNDITKLVSSGCLTVNYIVK